MPTGSRITSPRGSAQEAATPSTTAGLVSNTSYVAPTTHLQMLQLIHQQQLQIQQLQQQQRQQQQQQEQQQHQLQQYRSHFLRMRRVLAVLLRIVQRFLRRFFWPLGLAARGAEGFQRSEEVEEEVVERSFEAQEVEEEVEGDYGEESNSLIRSFEAADEVEGEEVDSDGVSRTFEAQEDEEEGAELVEVVRDFPAAHEEHVSQGPPSIVHQDREEPMAVDWISESLRAALVDEFEDEDAPIPVHCSTRMDEDLGVSEQGVSGLEEIAEGNVPEDRPEEVRQEPDTPVVIDLVEQSLAEPLIEDEDDQIAVDEDNQMDFEARGEISRIDTEESEEPEDLAEEGDDMERAPMKRHLAQAEEDEGSSPKKPLVGTDDNDDDQDDEVAEVNGGDDSMNMMEDAPPPALDLSPPQEPIDIFFEDDEDEQEVAVAGAANDEDVQDQVREAVEELVEMVVNQPGLDYDSDTDSDTSQSSVSSASTVPPLRRSQRRRWPVDRLTYPISHIPQRRAGRRRVNVQPVVPARRRLRQPPAPAPQVPRPPRQLPFHARNLAVLPDAPPPTSLAVAFRAVQFDDIEEELDDARAFLAQHNYGMAELDIVLSLSQLEAGIRRIQAQPSQAVLNRLLSRLAHIRSSLGMQ